ncbi:PREDICTED: RING finger protein 11-like isoform X1 [Thamnophis sirtalis]|uniref:RING finger protein 11 n=1 Tax=Thamnophis sirtalis TaxID=35019 RepID=A0A6I9XX60_9SAUR|nr:PREDICTED: RING finger protein 11-like isoform X1 [Thamnophis sirtalis]
MGGCLSSQAADDLSLLNDSTGDGASLGPGDPLPLPAPPPPYQEKNMKYQLHSAVFVLPTISLEAPLVEEKTTWAADHTPIPVYHPTPSQARLATQLTEEEQIRIAQRIGLIQHLPKGIFDPGSEPSEKKIKECVICMLDFVYGDPIRFLPCLHIYHVNCIDDWLMRSFTCPSCMEPVDAALLSSYETN